MSLEQERVLDRKRAEARERVRLAQERAARAWVAAHGPRVRAASRRSDAVLFPAPGAALCRVCPRLV